MRYADLISNSGIVFTIIRRKYNLNNFKYWLSLIDIEKYMREKQKYIIYKYIQSKQNNEKNCVGYKMI